MDPAAPLAGFRALLMHREPIHFQFTPISDTNHPKSVMYAVVDLEGKLSWVIAPATEVTESQSDSGDDIKEVDFGRILTSAELTDEVSKLDLGNLTKAEGHDTPQSLAIANMMAAATPSDGISSPSEDEPQYSVRAPTEVTGIFNATPEGHIQCRMYILTAKGAVLHTVDNFSTFRPMAPKKGAFPKFARLPAEIRDIIWKIAMPDMRIVRMRATIPHEGGPGWLFKSYATSIPGIVQACSESRHIAMEILTPAFEPDGVAYAGLVTYVNFAVDTLAVPFNTAKWMTVTDDANVIASREKIRNVMCYANTFRMADWTLDIFTTFVFTSSLSTWGQVQTWSFPGVKQDELRLARYTDWVCLEFRRPRTEKDVERYVKRAKKRVKKALDPCRSDYERNTVVGLRICFEDNPSPHIYPELLHKDVSILDW